MQWIEAVRARHPSRAARGRRAARRSRLGAATLDYVLLLCIVLPMAAFILWAGPRIMNLVYELHAVLVSWPFL